MSEPQSNFRPHLGEFFAAVWKQASGKDGLDGFDPGNPDHRVAVYDELMSVKLSSLRRWMEAPLYEKAASFATLEQVSEAIEFVEGALEKMARHTESLPPNPPTNHEEYREQLGKADASQNHEREQDVERAHLTVGHSPERASQGKMVNVRRHLQQAIASGVDIEPGVAYHAMQAASQQDRSERLNRTMQKFEATHAERTNKHTSSVMSLYQNKVANMGADPTADPYAQEPTMDDYYAMHKIVQMENGEQPLARDHFERVMRDPQLHGESQKHRQQAISMTMGGAALGLGLGVVGGAHLIGHANPAVRAAGVAAPVAGAIAGMGAGYSMSGHRNRSESEWRNAVTRNA